MEVEVIKKQDKNIDENGNPLKKLRVAAYARVSTELEEQQSSFISQQKYYLDKISDNPKWIFVEVYADEGISGTQAFKRENFMRMIKDAEAGKIDLILTKSISRFARNTLDTLNYVRLLRANNIPVVFEEENINTMDMSGELLLTVLSSVAQQESQTISSHIRLGYKMKRERGELVGFNSCFGYRYDSKKNEMKIIETEAKVVRMIFDLYLKGYGSSSIANTLTDLKILTPTGKEQWSYTTVSQILKNEKYAGDVMQGKSYVVDSLTHKRKVNNGEEDKYFIKDHHEPIIDRDIFDSVQQLLKSKTDSSVYKGRKPGSTKSILSGRLRCGYCGKVYSKRNGGTADITKHHWCCITSIKGAKTYCPDSKSLPEIVIRNTFMEAFGLLSNQNGLILNDFIDNLDESNRQDTPEAIINRLESEKQELKNKISKLIDLYVEGGIEKDILDKKQGTIEIKVSEINSQIDEIRKVNPDTNKYENTINKIKRELKSRESSIQEKEFDPDLFDKLVDYVIIGGFDEKNNKNEYLIRFICKNGFKAKSRDDISEDVIINNSLNNHNSTIYMNVLDFISNQNISIFEIENNQRKKKIIDKVRVRVDMEK